MARSIDDIMNVMLTEKAAHTELDGMNSTSSTALWRLIFYVCAVAIWTLEKLYDLFKLEVDDTISKLKPHSERWYAEKAKLFRYGQALIPNEDYYDDTGLTETDIAARQIIAYAAVKEQTRGLRVKVAKNAGADLGPLADDELDAFIFYMKKVKDAGVKLNITTSVADSLKLTLRVVYNPLVLTPTGSRIDGSSTTPVQDAIKDYLKNLPFNGVFSLQKLQDVVQGVEGVNDLNLDSASAQYGSLPFTSINISYLPDAGYLRFNSDADLVITFIAAT